MESKDLIKNVIYDGWEGKEERMERVGGWGRLNTRAGKLQPYSTRATSVMDAPPLPGKCFSCWMMLLARFVICIISPRLPSQILRCLISHNELR